MRPERPAAAEGGGRTSSSWVQPNKGETSRLARLRSSSGWAAKRAAASRSCTASGALKRQPVDAGHRHVSGMCSRATSRRPARRGGAPGSRCPRAAAAGRRLSSQNGLSSQRPDLPRELRRRRSCAWPSPIQPSSPILLRQFPPCGAARASPSPAAAAWWLSCGLGRRGRPNASWPRSATTRSTTSRIGGEERKLLSIDRSRKSRSIAAASRANQARATSKLARVGALEAEDRLLVVADGEDRPVPLRGALPGEIFAARARGRCSTGCYWCPAPRRRGYGRCAGRACSAPIRPCRA